MIKQSFLKTSSRRLDIRPYKMSDYPAWLKSRRVGLNNERNLSKDHFKKNLIKSKQLSQEDQGYFFAVFHKKSGENIGEIEINIIVRRNFHWGNLGFHIFPQFQNQGYATEAAQAVLKLAHDTLRLQRVEAAALKTNKPSVKVLRKSGMRSEGMRRSFIPTESGFEDALIFVSLRS